MTSGYSRWQRHNLQEALESRRIVLLSGARQCGKTTLAKTMATPSALYRTLDDITQLQAAQSDPKGFVSHGEELMIIDEVQREPLLLLSIKHDVDENTGYGRFLLTGSAQIQSLPSVKESLAGRVAHIRLRPLSMGELCYTQPDFITRAMAGDFPQPPPCAGSRGKGYDKDAYLAEAIQGGFPEVRRLTTHSKRRSWHRDYMDTLIQRDLQEIYQVRRRDALAKLLEVLATWSSKYLDISSIGTTLGLARPTVESYINALETLYIVERVKPWYRTDYQRVGKQEKLIFTDTGLMASLLGWKLEDIRLDGEKNGKLLETFVCNQLMALLDAQPEPYSLYHYRDREKREIDFIVENHKGQLLGIEVKAGSMVNLASFKHLLWFKKNIAKKKPFKAIVFYTGEHVLSFGDNLWAVPMSCLWA